MFTSLIAIDRGRGGRNDSSVLDLRPTVRGATSTNADGVHLAWCQTDRAHQAIAECTVNFAMKRTPVHEFGYDETLRRVAIIYRGSE